MILPKLNTITHKLNLPSTGQEIVYRPYTVEEEKILLTTQESDEAGDVLRAMKQVISNCLQNDEINIEKLPTFDLEYIFLNIRAKSTGDEIELMMKHENSINNKGEVCEHKQPVRILIDDIQVFKPEGHINKFQLDDNVGVQMKYPTFDTLSINTNNDDFEQLINLITASIDVIYDQEQVYDVSDASRDEVKKFIYSMNQKQLAKIQTFFETMPTLKHEVKYICSKCSCEEIVEVRGFQNFFS
jgi:hypothetical protein